MGCICLWRRGVSSLVALFIASVSAILLLEILECAFYFFVRLIFV